MRTPCSSGRSGLTILEVLVAVAIAGLLMGLLLPAVQSSREAARRAQCASNLYQIGVGLHAFAEVRGVLPRAGHIHRDLLPFVGYQALHSQFPTPMRGVFPDYRPFHNSVVPLYRCPSDGAARDRAASNFAGCRGSVPGSTSSHPAGDGMFPMYSGSHAVAFKEVTDGLSNTVALGEILVGTLEGLRQRNAWEMPPPGFAIPDQLGAFIDACDRIPLNPSQYGWRGWDGAGSLWYPSHPYDHGMTPNRPSCLNSGLHNGFDNSLFTANSHHPQGIHVLLGDNQVRFLSEQIEQSVWRNLASRSQ